MFVLVGVLGNTITMGTRHFFQIRMTCPHHAKSMSLLRHVFHVWWDTKVQY